MIAEAFFRQFLQLLPPGRAWQGATIRKILRALADEWERIDGRGADALLEFDPRTTTEMIDEWEAAVGLPDPCVSDWGALSLAQRRAAVVARLTANDSASRSFFINLAATLGYTVTITEYQPFEVGRSTVGEPLSNGFWQYAWTVEGVGVDDEQLQCAIEAKAPVHTIVLFNPI